MHTKAEKDFITLVKKFHKEQGRHHLPWRQTTDAYKILVSEIMLQQTQVERVIPKYRSFIKLFPNVKRLAAASLGEVLRAWQGLGYNRRAKLLHRCAQVIVNERGGVFPHHYRELVSLPAVGPYTAGAIMAFAYNTSVPIIETNIRTVYLHHFFKGREHVTDAMILELVTKTLDEKNPRLWYSALMDYGSFLKQNQKLSNKQSAQYKKQSVFKGSDRQIRGAIIRALAVKPLRLTSLYVLLSTFEKERVNVQLKKLEHESFIVHTKGTYRLP